MPRHDLRRIPSATGSVSGSVSAYGRDAASYDARTAGYEVYRSRVIDLLPLASGDVVLDVGCGTGLCFEHLIDRIGPTGTVVGVEPAAAMLELATERVAARGWPNVVLVGSPVERAPLPTVDHALFCAVHDVLQSAPALAHVLARVRDGGGVAATGGKWAPPWAVGVNAAVLAMHAPFVRSFAGFSRPWALLAERVPGLAVDQVALGGGYLAWGRVRSGRR
jgi:ubiquinone/menaquinone biosynthesis C-methylase UbiE